MAPGHPTRQQPQFKSYQLSLLNVSEFTITGLSISEIHRPTSLAGLRVPIRQISRDHGKAVYERDSEAFEGGKWRIPLGAYQPFYSYLTAQPNTRVEPIPSMQLKAASLGRARLEKDYPTPERLMQLGVPERLANTLAPFQRGGVDFVHDKKGKALIADKMGLGKSIQSIASMTMYHKEWPVLVLSPSGARYHWQNEFVNWCGEEEHQATVDFNGTADGDKEQEGKDTANETTASSNGDKKGNGLSSQQKAERVLWAEPMPPLRQSEVHVLTSAKDRIFPSSSTKVVICSYGLAPRMAEDGTLKPGMFRCAIVDESHMLKNRTSKRTSQLVPILQACTRCILLSGTPAFARPMELHPQLSILGTTADSWWLDEKQFTRKYVKGGSVQRRAELHTLLSSSMMIRRMKNDILKQLPPKQREQAIVNVCDAKARKDFQECIVLLRQGKGALASFARAHTAENDDKDDNGNKKDDKEDDEPPFVGESPKQNRNQKKKKEQSDKTIDSAQSPPTIDIEAVVAQELQTQWDHRIQQIQYAMSTQPSHLNPIQQQELLLNLQNQVRQELDVYRIERTQQLRHEQFLALSRNSNTRGGNGQDGHDEQNTNNDSNEEEEEDAPRDRKSLLTYMYKQTGKAKIPLVLEMLRLWMGNPASGKVCIFAHHISVLNALEKSPSLAGKDIHIRIDGSTSPKARQEQINRFQTDPAVRVALLGITAAGVAVTLTASATVWFTELFWTPALLIQAEDRCHRIGQQARVRCLYLVAKGTLDEILWKHVEKKFRDLGEFVEGKEKMKIVLHKTYRGVKALKESLTPVDTEFDADGEMDEEEPDDMIGFETELHDDLEEMEREMDEKIRAEQNDPDDDDNIEGTASSQSGSGPANAGGNQNAATGAAPAAQGTAGTTESEAICLSDDDDDDDDVVDIVDATNGSTDSKKTETVTGNNSNNAGQASGGKTEGLSNAIRLTPERVHVNLPLPQMKIYKLTFTGTSYGLEIDIFKGRIFVKGKTKPILGPTNDLATKPAIGDLMLSINGQMIPFSVQFKSLKDFLAAAIVRGPVEIVFGEDEQVSQLICSIIKDKSSQGRSQPQVAEILPMLKEHSFLYDGSYPINIEAFQGFLYVTNETTQESKNGPTVGDILRRVDGEGIPFKPSRFAVRKTLRRATKTSPVQIMVRQANVDLSQFFSNMEKKRRESSKSDTATIVLD